MNLNWQNLKDNRDDVLKAEIGSLLFNLGKTHIGFSFWKDFFKDYENEFKFISYKEYYKDEFAEELDSISSKLKDFIFDKTTVKINEEKKWIEYFKGVQSNSNIVKKIFFRGCENVNSGIDKGSPKEQLKGKLWISNAFGSFKEEVKKNNFDSKRREFFENLHHFLEENNYYENQNWKHIRDFVIKKLKNWYTHLLSDSRFPVNDVTLYDQAYMSATMFKAALAGMTLETSESKKYLEKLQSIKWQILGIQYDKLSLAEKGLKPAHIFLYREVSNNVDDEITKLIEIDYTLGNEIYRDESGIYFLVPVGVDKDFENVKLEIKQIFKNKFDDEIYPYITFSKASRGIMNLTNLLEKAKENFLKADYSLKSELFPNGENGICQVCKSRIGKKEKYDRYLVCDICRERREGRIDKWLRNQEGETIWIDEIADKNNRVALVTLKFELIEWLNGDLLSSLLTRNENFQKWFQNIEIFFKLFYSNIDILEVDLSQLGKEITSEQGKSLGRKNGLISGIKKDLGKLKNFLYEIRNNRLKPFNEKIKTNAYENFLLELMLMFFKNLDRLYEKINELLNDNEIFSVLSENKINKLMKLRKELEKYKIEIFILHFTEDAYNGCKKWGENFDDYIQQIFFGSVLGTDFEEKIKKSPLNTKIDWQNEKINWNKLKEGDIDLLSKLLIQFLLRKNPSPARLRRVWESTQEFFEKVKREILDSYTAQRTKKNFKEKVPDFADLINNTDFKETEFKQYFSIIDSTPISWQFIIPTNKVVNLLKQVQKLYYQNFKYVNGKLPLHIGIVVQKSKDPLYIGIKALRNIRRDIKEWSEIKRGNFIFSQNYLDEIDNKIALSYEKKNNSDDFYSLYETDNADYDFMLLPSGKGVKKYNSTDRFVIYPNTIDFEFLDTNSRRNEIYYKNGKRVAQLKNNRPYTWEEFEKFENFKEMFSGKTALLHRLVSLIYSKMEDWKSNEESFKRLMSTTFERIKKQDGVNVSNIFDIENFDFNEAKKFIDMFEFWHTTLKDSI